MNKYKVGDKIVLTVTSTNEMGCLPCYVLNDDLILSKQDIDKYSEPLTAYTEPLEAKIRRQAAEITRLLEENKRLKAENGNSLWNIEQARAEGAETAWELAREILFEAKQGGMEDEKYKAIFGSGNPSAYVIKNHTYSEAAAKVAEWEKERDEIKAGDVFEFTSGGKAVVMKVYEDGEVALFFPDGGCGIYEPGESWNKTGRHIDIDSFLKQIGEEQE